MFTIMITPVENPPPVIAFADLITVDEGGRAPLSFHHFFAADDQDNLQRDAIIKLSALPKYGCIENMGTGTSSRWAVELFRTWQEGRARGRHLPPFKPGRGGG